MCQTFTFRVSDIHCNHCKETIEKTVSAVAGVEGVAVDVEQGVVTVRAEMDVSDGSLRAAIAEAGYTAA